MPRKFRPDPPLVLGILGGVGSGKSELSALLADRGLLVLDADREAARILASLEMKSILQDLFGPEVLGPNGPRRERIAEGIFTDPGLRKRLEEAMHPQIRQAMLSQMDVALAAGQSVVLDVPLLLEGGLIDRCDRVLYLEVPDALREARALARGMAPKDWRRREAVQADLSQKRGHADHVFDNSDTIEVLEGQVEAWIAAGASASAD